LKTSFESYLFVLGIPLKDHPLIVRKVLKSLWFVTSHTNQVRRYRLKSFGRPANEHKFVKDQGEQITVADYFDDKWKIRLRHPQLPVVELYNPADKSKSHHLPMELVTVDEWQRSLKPLTTDQRARVTKKTVVRPGERYGMIRRVADERQFNKDSYLEKFGINVDVNEMLLVPARILPSPEIKYKSSRGDQGDVVERVQIGKWWLNNRFNKAREIRTWAVVLVSQREPDNRQIRLASDFASKIPQVRRFYFI
jgi:eukaryotic translation initiation factor 2C